jgi:ankyrin repeat protein
MVSALWKACAEGDLENVHQLLQDASTLDLEIRGKHTSGSLEHIHDLFNCLQSFCTTNSIHISSFFFLTDHTGVTPLIEAIKNGHVEVVRALLDKGSMTQISPPCSLPCPS